MTSSEEKIWANSGDSHLVEPPDLFSANLPADLAERMPRSVKDPDGEFETVHIDGESFRRKLPKLETILKNMARPEDDASDPIQRAPGANDPDLRLKDLDEEGIWAEVDLSVPRDLGVQHQGSEVDTGGSAGAQRLGARFPEPFASVHLLRIGTAARRR